MDGFICVVLGFLLVVGGIAAIIVHWAILLVRSKRYELPTLRRTAYTNVPTLPLDEPAIVRRHLERLYKRGLIDLDTLNAVHAALTRAELERTSTPIRTESVAAAVHHTEIAPPPLPVLTLHDDTPPLTTAPPAPKPVIPLPPPPPPTPAAPRRSWTQLLEAFMEQSNIRWGELIGGLLIVGCSIALVFTFWDWIAARPWFQFFLFTAITTALFGVGLYTEHRWKLPTTSRGLLLISTLLVPLNFLAITAFSRGAGPMAAIRIAGELLAISLFSWLVYLAGRILVRSWAHLLAVGVVSVSATQVIVHRLASPTIATETALFLVALPLAIYCGILAIALLQAKRWPDLTSERVYALFTLLGTFTFSILPPLGLLGFRIENTPWLLHHSAPLLVLAGLPALCTGLLLWRRITDPSLASERTAATSVALVGAMISLAAFVLIWPHAHATWIYAAYGIATLLAAYAAAAPVLTYLGSLLLGAATAQALVFRFPTAPTSLECWTIASLAHATLMLLGVAVATTNTLRHVFRHPLLHAALASSLLAAPLLLASAALPDIRSTVMPMLATRAFWLAGLWLLLSLLALWPALFSAFQAMLTLAVAFTAISVLQHHPWFASSPHPLSDPWTIQVLGISVALLGLLWTALRLATHRWIGRLWRTLLTPPWPTVDHLLNVPVLLAAMGLAAFAIIPGLAAELSTHGIPRILVAPYASTLHAHAIGAGTWLLFTTLILALLARQWERFTAWPIYAIVVLLGCACPLLAARWTHQFAAASAWRWSASLLLVLLSIPLWFRPTTAALLSRLRWPQFNPHQDHFWRDLRILLLTLTILPILALTLYPSIQMLSGTPIVGPAPDSFFARIGNAASYLPPLLLLMLALIGYALRQRSNAFALSAGLVLNLTVTLGYLLSLVTNNIAIDSLHLVRLAQFNAIASSAFALAWIAIRTRARTAQDATSPATTPPELIVQIALAAAALLITLLPAELAMYTRLLTTAHAQAAHPWGWLACALTGAALLWPTWQSRRQIPTAALGITLLLLGSLASLTLYRFTTDLLLTQHALLTSRALAGWILLAIGWIAQTSLKLAADSESDSMGATGSLLPVPIPNPLPPATFTLPRPSITRWSANFGLLTLLLAFANLSRANIAWAVAGVIATSTLAVALSAWTLRREWLYPAALLLNVAATLWWIITGHTASTSPLLDLLQINLLILAASGLGTLLLDLHLFRPARHEVVRRGLPPFHHLAACAGVLAIAVLSVLLLLGNLALASSPNLWLTIASTLAIIALLVACLWDIDARYPLPGLYILGLASAATAMALLDWNLTLVTWRGTIFLAAYAVLLGYLFTLRVNLARFAEQLGIPPRPTWPVPTPSWIGVVVLLQSLLVHLAAAMIVLTWNDLPIRLAVATSAIAAAVAIGLLAKDLDLGFYHRTSLLAALTGAILWGFAWLGQQTHGWLLNRAVVLMLVTAAMTAFYAVGLVKLLRQRNAWTRAAYNLVPAVGGLMIGSLILIFATELLQADTHGTDMAPWGVAAVATALLGLAAAAIVCAVVPGRDPLALSERGRTAYVYAAELLLALLFLHLRLNYPSIFAIGVWKRFWPFIIMALAFAGVALSELFRRQRRHVLAEPLERTGAFLPLLPVLAYWATTTQPAWNSDFSYATALLLAGLVYTILAVLRKNYIFGLLAALMANGSLWAVLYHLDGLAFTQHPQLWLIPLAVSTLVAAHLNRDRLTVQQLQTLRYLALLTIYVSSTSEIFLHSLDDAPWLPLVLAILSVAGVLCGILLRIQSFLILGTLFLLVAIASMIQYATHQVGSYWPWAVAGIVLGIAMVALFALAEKKREQMLQLVHGLKEWQR